MPHTPAEESYKRACLKGGFNADSYGRFNPVTLATTTDGYYIVFTAWDGYRVVACRKTKKSADALVTKLNGLGSVEACNALLGRKTK